MLSRIEKFMFSTTSQIGEVSYISADAARAAVLPPSNIYHTCGKLHMSAPSLDALCDDNLSSLIIDGKATKDQLTQAWVLILAEYYELRDDGLDGNEQCSLSRDIQKLNNHLYHTGHLCKVLVREVQRIDCRECSKTGLLIPAHCLWTGWLCRWVEYGGTEKQVENTRSLQQLQKQLEGKMQLGDQEKPKRETFRTQPAYYEEMQGTPRTTSMNWLWVKYVMLEKKYADKVEQLKMLHAK